MNYSSIKQDSSLICNILVHFIDHEVFSSGWSCENFEKESSREELFELNRRVFYLKFNFLLFQKEL